MIRVAGIFTLGNYRWVVSLFYRHYFGRKLYLWLECGCWQLQKLFWNEWGRENWCLFQGMNMWGEELCAPWSGGTRGTNFSSCFLRECSWWNSHGAVFYTCCNFKHFCVQLSFPNPGLRFASQIGADNVEQLEEKNQNVFLKKEKDQREESKISF